MLRRTLNLGEDELIAGPAETIELAAGCIDVDALEFERLVDDAGDGLKRAATLYGGEFLEGLDTREPAFDDWLTRERQQLRERARTRCRGCSRCTATAAAPSAPSTRRCACWHSIRCRKTCTAR